MKDQHHLRKNMRNSPHEDTLLKWRVRHTLQPKDITNLAHLHGLIYAKEHGYDETFERYVFEGLTRFAESFHPDKDNIWLVEQNGKIIGSLAIVGQSKQEAQLRWFLVHPKYRRHGLGTLLINSALQYCKRHSYTTLYLWSTSELHIAHHLYRNAGFRKTQIKSHMMWGKNVEEEKYELHWTDDLC
jgi:N-acetylglutamate synthase-like GNAT family acetyltransferase